MCNLYSITKNQAAIRDLFKVAKDSAGNLPPLPAIFPDQMAPVVRVNEGERELTMMRWGMPNPPQFPGITTNIRNAGSPDWRRWLAPQSRCLVPMTPFGKSADTRRKKTPKWSPSMRVDHSSLSPGYGPNGPAFAAPGLY